MTNDIIKKKLLQLKDQILIFTEVKERSIFSFKILDDNNFMICIRCFNKAKYTHPKYEIIYFGSKTGFVVPEPDFDEQEIKLILDDKKGFASFTIEDNGEAYLQMIKVDPKHRGKGIGTLMMDYAKELFDEENLYAIDEKVTKITGCVMPLDEQTTNAALFEFYLKNGADFSLLQENLIEMPVGKMAKKQVE